MSEAHWYYLHEGQRIGPITQEQIVEVFRSGAMPLETMVRSDLFGYWVPASTIAGFRMLVPAVGAALDTKAAKEQAAPISTAAAPVPVAPVAAATIIAPAPSAAAPVAAAPVAAAPGAAPPPVAQQTRPAVPIVVPAFDAPRPWRRWAARWIDETLALIVWTALLAAVAPFTAPSMLTRLVLLFAIFPAAFVVIEAAMLYGFGATPGKALFGVIVRDPDGAVLSFGRALHRSFRVFVQGIGMGLPVLSLCTVLSAYFSLHDGGVTAWDRAGRFSVTHRPIGLAQRLTALLILMGALLIHFRTLAIALYGS
ncbi:MAG TPA: RDD family protein [Tepidisphaeraceae bacterium]|jgi:uncharacterized RDD family membrane protein YckC